MSKKDYRSALAAGFSKKLPPRGAKRKQPGQKQVAWTPLENIDYEGGRREDGKTDR